METDTFLSVFDPIRYSCVRIGNNENIPGVVHHYKLDNTVDRLASKRNVVLNQKTRMWCKKALKLEKEVLLDAGFVFSTQCALYRDLIKDHFTDPANKFDYAIVDEASQSFLGFSLMAIHMAKRVIFAGDHMQLPPVVKADMYTHILEKSLFERLVIASKDQGRDRYTLLDE